MYLGEILSLNTPSLSPELYFSEAADQGAVR